LPEVLFFGSFGLLLLMLLMLMLMLLLLLLLLLLLFLNSQSQGEDRGLVRHVDGRGPLRRGLVLIDPRLLRRRMRSIYTLPRLPRALPDPTWRLFFKKKFSVAVLPWSVVFVLFHFLDVAGPSRPPSLSSHIYVPPAAQALNHLKRPLICSCTVCVRVFVI
jgi:hypothetical protein